MSDIDVRAITWPVTPVIPAKVTTNQRITSGQTNSEVQCLQDLWTNLQAVGAIAISDPTSVKGDIMVRSATALTKLGVGTANQVLSVNAGSPVGIQWSTISASSVGAVPVTRQVIAGTGLSGGGALSADVTLTANVVSVNGQTGAVVLTAGSVGGVPAARQVIAGAGLTGGGALSADVTLTADMTKLVGSFNGRFGTVTLTTADITNAGGVPATRQVIAGTGLTGGGLLNGDVTLNVAAGQTIQKVRVSKDGTLVAAQQEIDFQTGANTVLTVANDAANNRVRVRIDTTGGSGGGAQTPWLTDVDAANHSLTKLKDLTIDGYSGVNHGTITWRVADKQRWQIGVNSDTPHWQLIRSDATGTFTDIPITVKHDTGGVDVIGAMTIKGSPFGTAGDLCEIRLPDTANRIKTVFARGISFDVPGYADAMTIQNGGNVGVGTTSPRYALHVITPNRSSAATATQIAIGEQSNNPDYRFSLGYYNDSMTWYGTIQSTQGGAGGPLLLNPAGGNIGIGTNNPTAKLTVDGIIACLDINCANVNVENSGGNGGIAMRVDGFQDNLCFVTVGGGGIKLMPNSVDALTADSASNVTVHKALVCQGSLTATSKSLTADYTTAAVVLKETSGASGFSGAPRISFWWNAAAVASQIGIDSGGTITCLTWDGSTYTSLRCGNFYSSGNVAAVTLSTASSGNVAIQSPGGAVPGPDQILRTQGNGYATVTHLSHNPPTFTEEGGGIGCFICKWPSDPYLRGFSVDTVAQRIFGTTSKANLLVLNTGITGYSCGTAVGSSAYGALYYDPADQSISIYHSGPAAGYMIKVKPDGIYMPVMTGTAGPANSGRLYRAGNDLMIS